MKTTTVRAILIAVILSFGACEGAPPDDAPASDPVLAQTSEAPDAAVGTWFMNGDAWGVPLRETIVFFADGRFSDDYDWGAANEHYVGRWTRGASFAMAYDGNVVGTMLHTYDLRPETLTLDVGDFSVGTFRRQ